MLVLIDLLELLSPMSYVREEPSVVYQSEDGSSLMTLKGIDFDVQLTEDFFSLTEAQLRLGGVP